MLIFLIPAIYPSKDRPQLGIYVKEHCKAVRNEMNCQFVILNASTIRINKYNIHSKIDEYDDEVGRVIQRYTPCFAQSTFPISAVLSYKQNVYKLFAHALKKYGKPDLIYAHFSFPAGYTTIALSKKYNIPYVVDEHYSLYFREHLHPYIKWITKKTIINSKMFLCVSEHLRNAIYKQTGITDGIEIIPNLVDDRYCYCDRIEKKEFVFFTAGNFFTTKE